MQRLINNAPASHLEPVKIPIFIETPDVYRVLCRHLDLQDLARLAMTSKLSHKRFTEILLNHPGLLLNALVKMSKRKISSFLRQYPLITEQILALHDKQPANPSAFALWALVVNINEIDHERLNQCIMHFNLMKNVKVLRTLKAIRFMILLSKQLSCHDKDKYPLTYDNSTGHLFNRNCYLNLHGLKLPMTRNFIPTLIGFDFSYANFRGAFVEWVIFDNLSLRGADLFMATMLHIHWLSVLDCRGANFSETRLVNVRLMNYNAHDVLLEGAVFKNTHFFPSSIMIYDDLYEALGCMPFCYLAPDDNIATLSNANHKMLLSPVLEDLIRTVNNYTDNDFTYLKTNYVLFKAPATLHEHQLTLLETAKINRFFADTDSIFKLSVQHAITLGLFSKPPFLTPSQRMLQHEIRQIERQNNVSSCTSASCVIL